MLCNVSRCSAIRCPHNKWKYERLKECSLDEVTLNDRGECEQYKQAARNKYVSILSKD